MKFTIAREALLQPLNLVAGVVERRQTLPILSNVLLRLEEGVLSLTGTDLEVELVGRVELEDPEAVSGEITVPAKKLVDICKSLPDGAVISFVVDNQRAVVKSGRSRFTLSTLSAADFPAIDDEPSNQQFSLTQGELKRLIDCTAFAMAQQDVRYYLNGMLWEIKNNTFKAVSTDGHRLAMCTLNRSLEVDIDRQLILPRKGVLEMNRLLLSEDDSVELVLGDNHLRAKTEAFTFTTKLVDGKFPDYERVLPQGAINIANADRSELKQALSRVAILSNEKYRGVRLKFETDTVNIVANNPEQEEAEEVVSLEYNGAPIEIGFNVSYILDVLSVLNCAQVKFSLVDAVTSAKIEESVANGISEALYVIMPMRL
ncbi:DNA polymerase-3 subunit beta [Sinobacterium caligoides]|uniref:Beta sliding clamp n=1 Tax=Sinobacterium caligoides TaxID=933926 RepID=A0A3N2DGU2_9GAMM|nr:DNA polymerase III subunit beta [Sinobacterium caligoides]ROR99026.1 DNA polymerase-3 subunit beta [Sinobacterium caligoides]